MTRFLRSPQFWLTLVVCVVVFVPEVLGQNASGLTNQLRQIQGTVKTIIRIVGGIAALAYGAIVVAPKYMQNDPDANKALRSLFIGVAVIVLLDSIVGLIG